MPRVWGFFVDPNRKRVFVLRMEEFFTRDNANNGIELPLFTPDGGKTEHTMQILGVDSDEFQATELREKRKVMALEAEAKDLKESERAEFFAAKQKESELEILVSLISGWTFEQECNHENKLKFLTNAPQIADQINRVAANRRLFFLEGQSDSKSSQ